ncbi:29487_t:CDS:2 [Gigaspora margarita]|uniref:29487_t:CDS:1 n=1 Tax=Gigaspora margarita TaxID=4874 RepID=A0ABM8VY72_GIGMA|nr:29487_t:CDS:2 [Gigaspora margarita]
MIGTVPTTNISTTSNQTQEIICYNCGRSRHIARQCPNLVTLANNGPSVQTAPTQNPLTVNGIPESDETLFLPADWHEHRKPIANTPILRKKNEQVLDSSSGLVETKEVEDPDEEMAEGQTEQEKDPEIQNKLEFSRKNDLKRLENRISYSNGEPLRDNDKEIKKEQCKVGKIGSMELWPVTYLSSGLEEYQPISDLFDYYYEHEVQIGIEYKTGTLDETQQDQIRALLDEYEDLSA